MGSYYLKIKKKIYGPYSSAKVKELYKKRKISKDTEIRKRASRDWYRVAEMFRIKSKAKVAGHSVSGEQSGSDDKKKIVEKATNPEAGSGSSCQKIELLKSDIDNPEEYEERFESDAIIKLHDDEKSASNKAQNKQENAMISLLDVPEEGAVGVIVTDDNLSNDKEDSIYLDKILKKKKTPGSIQLEEFDHNKKGESSDDRSKDAHPGEVASSSGASGKYKSAKKKKGHKERTNGAGGRASGSKIVLVDVDDKGSDYAFTEELQKEKKEIDLSMKETVKNDIELVDKDEKVEGVGIVVVDPHEIEASYFQQRDDGVGEDSGGLKFSESSSQNKITLINAEVISDKNSIKMEFSEFVTSAIEQNKKRKIKRKYAKFDYRLSYDCYRYGFGKFRYRVEAFLLDYLLIMVTFLPFIENYFIHKFYFFIVAVTGFFYFFIFHALFGKTPGKFLMGIKVVDIRGDKLTFALALVRQIAATFSWIGLFGYFLAWIDEDNRSFHDMLCKTYVINAFRRDID